MTKTSQAIEFRAFHKPSQRMFYTIDAIHFVDGTLSMLHISYDEASFVLFHADNCELLRWTGLLDKNNVKIWQGDIIRYGAFALNDFEKYGEQCWEQLPEGINEGDISTVYGIYEVIWNYSFLCDLENTMIRGNPDVTGVEVIGNRYENAEFLEQVQN